MEKLDISTVLSVDSIRRVCSIKNEHGVSTTIGLATNVQIPPNSGEIRAIISQSSKKPMIIGFAHPSSYYQDDEQIDKNVDSGALEMRVMEAIFGSNNTYQSHNEKDSGLNYRGRKPYDLIPGDIEFSQEYWGNSLVIGMGGINQLKVSNKNFFLQSLIDNLARLMAGNLEIITDFGVLKFDNTDDKVKMQLKADREFNKKVMKGLYDIQLEMGSCDDGNTVSFKYKTEKSNEPYIFTIDTKGRVFLNVPSDHCAIYNENHVESVAKNKGLAVQEDYEIDVGKKYILTANGAGDIKLGSEGLSAEQNELVRRPHLEDKYKPLIESMQEALSGPLEMDMNFVPFFLRSEALFDLWAECALQNPLVLSDTTDKTWAE